MKFVRLLFVVCLFGSLPLSYGQETGAASPPAAASASEVEARGSSASNTAAENQQRLNNNAAAAVSTDPNRPATPDLLEHFVDAVLARFDIRSSGNTTTHFVIAAMFLVGAFVLRRAVIIVIFGIFRKLASRTKTTLDDKLFPALETPAATFIVVLGLVAALRVLKLSPSSDRAISYGSTMAFSLCVFWILLRAFNTILDHLEQVSRSKNLGIAAFMPWIKKTLVTVFIIFGVLMVAQSLGADVKAFLAGLGIGGLAFALAAQDTIANLFGSVVVAIDQPFKIGEAVKIGGQDGVVEDIGLRSTKLRRPDKSLAIIPNKTVAAEVVVNLSRFTQRRVEQTLGLTYDAKPEQLEAIVNEIRELILAESEVEKPSVIVQFTNLGASSLDIWIAYQTLSPDFVKHLQLKQRLNLKFMRAVASRGLAFAFPTQTIQLDGEIARRLVDRPAGPDQAAPPAPRV